MTNTTTDTATDAQDLGEVRHLDPATLVLDDNVRTDADATITAAFVRSVAERVRVPLLAYENAAGEVVVWDGQRRLLAAREAGLGTVPVYITSRDAADEQATTVERITGQVITADLTRRSHSGPASDCDAPVAFGRVVGDPDREGLAHRQTRGGRPGTEGRDLGNGGERPR
ncbi:ParB N-terminal domain-containing protein (plasmid) [Gordonia polyisoprenivorans]|uniref:ParB N-terminal domain-containing protein n=1 Tax=Gordonia polyisoprenivorans TaxID=84595 RepID=UPI002234A693|nr:ParB N-terminal domain-containing protein [Gordonia polyisoprenivorans]